MSYLVPTDLVEKMVIAGAVKMNMTKKTTLIRAIMAGAILGLAAVFAITVAIKRLLEMCIKFCNTNPYLPMYPVTDIIKSELCLDK